MTVTIKLTNEEALGLLEQLDFEAALDLVPQIIDSPPSGPGEPRKPPRVVPPSESAVRRSQRRLALYAIMRQVVKQAQAAGHAPVAVVVPVSPSDPIEAQRWAFGAHGQLGIPDKSSSA